jgi:hypothetical protein
MNFSKYKHIVFSLAASGLLLIGLFLLLNEAPRIARADPGDLFVSTTGSGSACTQAAPCALQTALENADGGNTIYIAGGDYIGGGGAVITITKSITLYGGWDGSNTTPPVRDPDAHPTTLNGEGVRRGVYISGNITPTLQGLRITGGDAAGLGGYEYYGTYDAGGGVYVIAATVTLADNDIFSNTAQHGAGVFLGNSLGALDHNTIFSNTATSGGGGVFAYKGAPILSGNVIISNTSSSIGGGLYLFSTTPSLLYNTIASNGANQGGGVTVASCNPIFTGNVIADNEAKLGGGVRLWYSRSPFTNNLIADNRATVSGSGLWLGGSKLSLWHTTLARNTGGDGSGVFVTNAGSTHSTVILTNTILVSHTVGISATAGSTVTLEATLWANGTDWGGDGAIFTGTVNIWGNPAFVNPDGGDYHIGPGSAARNAGVNAGVNTDIDGEFRPKEGGYDIGADEFGQQWDIYLPLVVKNYP